MMTMSSVFLLRLLILLVCCCCCHTAFSSTTSTATTTTTASSVFNNHVKSSVLHRRPHTPTKSNDGSLLSRTTTIRGGGRLLHPASDAPLASRGGQIAALKMAKGSGDDTDTFAPPTFDKTTRESKFIEETLKTSYTFTEFPRKALDPVVGAFEKVYFDQDSIIMRQGDTDADYMYILAGGECSVIIDDRVLPEPYGTMQESSVIGELALLYDTKRAATITAKTNVVAYRLDRRSLRYFLTAHGPNQRSAGGGSMDADISKAGLLKIDKAIDKITGMKSRYGGTIIREYKPARGWLWRQWTGTVFQAAWKTTLANVMVALLLSAFARSLVPHGWSMGTAPDKTIPWIARLDQFRKLWGYLMQITTFILTFFLQQAYSLWRDVYNTARRIQGRLNDIGLLLALSARRTTHSKSSKIGGLYTDKASVLLDDVGGYCRLCHAFAWAKFSAPFQVLLSDRGMSRMLSRGLLTKTQYEILQSLDPQVGGPSNACLEWIGIRALQGMRDGSLECTDEAVALRQVFLGKLSELRGTIGSIPDILDGRMPLIYVHFVQILVDTFVVSAPFALYSELGIWSVPATLILTTFYSGLLQLSKILLDPLGNDKYYRENVNMDIGVLIRESNAGSTRWKAAGERLPFKV